MSLYSLVRTLRLPCPALNGSAPEIGVDCRVSKRNQAIAEKDIVGGEYTANLIKSRAKLIGILDASETILESHDGFQQRLKGILQSAVGGHEHVMHFLIEFNLSSEDARAVFFVERS